MDIYLRVLSITFSNIAPSIKNNFDYLLMGSAIHHKFTITSGLAIGIDGISHKTALKHDGITVAVLGSGLNKLYPTQHTILNVLQDASPYPAEGTDSKPLAWPCRAS